MNSNIQATELRDAWIKALRSGEYAQTQSRLKVSDDDSGEAKYCCLGVLCEVAGVEIPNYSETLDKSEHLWKLRDALGLGVWETMGAQYKLANLNDDDGLTFPQIADWIEKNVMVSA